MSQSTNAAPAFDQATFQRFLAFEAFLAAEGGAKTSGANFDPAPHETGIDFLYRKEGDPKKRSPKASPNKAPAAPKAPRKDRVLNRTTRKAFVLAHPWAKGLSAIQIAEAALSEPKEFPLVDGWTISEARANRALLGEWK